MDMLTHSSRKKGGRFVLGKKELGPTPLFAHTTQQQESFSFSRTKDTIKEMFVRAQGAKAKRCDLLGGLGEAVFQGSDLLVKREQFCEESFVACFEFCFGRECTNNNVRQQLA